MSVGSAWDLSSDAELITAVRSGENAAFAVIYERHVDAARAVARRYSNSSADAEDAVSEAFSRVFSAVQEGGGPDVAIRAYLFTVLRRVALERVEGARRDRPTDDVDLFENASVAVAPSDEEAMAGFERGVVSQAYKSLPERWRAVLWYTEVESLTAVEIAPILGLTANGVAALAYRAREGLRQAYLQQHLAVPASEACTLVNSKLGAFVRGGLAQRETALVDSHLEECGRCRALVLELGDVNHGMRAFIAPLVLGAISLSVLHGVGFGGAAGSAVSLGAAAAGGAAAPTGAGGAGSPGGAGATGAQSVGSGAAGSGGATVASGVAASSAAAIAVGVGIAGLSGGEAAAAGATGAVSGAGGAGGAGSGAGGAGSGAGGAGGAGGIGAAADGAAAGGTAASAAASAGGIAALVAATPVAVLGIAAAVAIVAVGLGVAGALGAFSGGVDEGLAGAAPTSIVSSAPAESSDAPTDASTDAPSSVPTATTPPDGEADADATEPAGGTAGAGGVTGPGGAIPSTAPTTTPSSPPTSTPSIEPTTPPLPATLTLGPVAAVDLTAGVRAPLTLLVTNSGGMDAATVTTDLVFPVGTAWDVDVTPLPVGGGGAAVPRVATGTSWTCTAVGLTTARCTLPGLPAGASSSLRLSVLVDDLVLDGERDLDVTVTTWISGSSVRVTQNLPTHLASAPGRLAVQDAGSVGLTAAVDRATSTLVTFPVSNQGRTTLRDVHVEVALPTDLPAGVEVSASSLSRTWTCDASARVLDCTTGSIGPAGKADLLLDVTAPALDLSSASPLIDVEVAAALKATAGTTSATASVTIRSAPGLPVVAAVSPTNVQAHQVRTVRVGVHNGGGTSLRELAASIVLPSGLTSADMFFPTDWLCSATSTQLIECSLDAPLVPGADAPILVAVQAGPTVEGQIAVSVSGAGVSASTVFSDVALTTASFSFEPELTAGFILGDGTLTFGVASTGTTKDLTAIVTVPKSIVLAEPVQANVGTSSWQCSRIDDQHVKCNLGVLTAGKPLAVELSATASAATAQSAVVEVTDGRSTITSMTPLAVASGGLGVRGEWAGGYAVTEVGTPVLGCDLTTAACTRAMGDLAGGASNNSQVMVPLANPVADLQVPDGRDVVFAGLYWSGNRQVGSTVDPWTGPLTGVQVRAPGAEPVTVPGVLLAMDKDTGGREYYQSFAEVTTLVRTYGNGLWAVDDVAYAATMTDKVRSYYAGWSLVVVYATPGVDQDVALYDGGAVVTTGSSVTFAFESGADLSARIGVVAWEGDRNAGGNGGDSLSLGTQLLAPRRADGSLGSPKDAFSSTATGSGFNNSLGVDVTSYATVPVAAGINRLTAATSSDQYFLGAVTVTTTAR